MIEAHHTLLGNRAMVRIQNLQTLAGFTKPNFPGLDDRPVILVVFPKLLGLDVFACDLFHESFQVPRIRSHRLDEVEDEVEVQEQ